MNERDKDKTGQQKGGQGGQGGQGGFGQQQRKPGQPLPTEKDKDKGGKGTF